LGNGGGAGISPVAGRSGIDVTVSVERPDGTKSSFVVTARLDTPVEVNYYRNGGILQTVLRKLLR